MTSQVDKPASFDFFGVTVYNADELKDYDPNFFLGCSRGVRKIIDKKKIADSEYSYGSQSKSGWKKCDSTYPKGKLLLKSDWVHENVPKMAITNNVHYEVDPAPPVLELDDHEKFIDSNNKILDIEVRGERNSKKCYFKVSDVAREFEILKLDETIIDKRYDGYQDEIHYKYFTIQKHEDPGKNVTKTTLKKTLFLTYNGMIRVLFCSRNKNAERFQDWATERLFTLQMGTTDQKDELVAEIKGITTKNVKSMFAKSSSFPCVYLYKLNTAKELRNTFDFKTDIQDDAIICKYGQTGDFERRTKQHDSIYGKMKNVQLELVTFVYIDPKYTSEAESDLKSYFNDFGMKLDIDGRSELVVIQPHIMKQVKKKYEQINSIYAGRNTELCQQVKDLKHNLELVEEKHQLQTKHYKLEIDHLKKDADNLKETILLKEQVFQTELEKQQLEIKIRDERIVSMEMIRDLEHKLIKAQGINI
jgi:hypothetical protein